jgi:tripartite-type tricarboxylate transporter receptor subunit TctC
MKEETQARGPSRRELVAAGLGFGLALALPAARAQGGFNRDKPVRLMVGFAPGGTNDILARAIAPTLGEALGTTVIVENHAGANGIIAAQMVARDAPDGHTLLFTFAGTMAQNPHTIANLPYDPFKDFTPVGLVAVGPQVLLAWKGLPVNNVRELIAYAKANPGKLSISSSGTGTSTHVYAEILMRRTGIQLLHVPYKGAGDAARDLSSGVVQLTFTGAPTAVQLIGAGHVKPLGVTAAQRSSLMPDIPTMTEQGVPGLDLQGWQAIFGPAKMPRPVLDTLNAALVKAIADPQLKQRVAKTLWEAKSSTPEELRRIVERDYKVWGSLMSEFGIRPQ